MKGYNLLVPFSQFIIWWQRVGPESCRVDYRIFWGCIVLEGKWVLHVGQFIPYNGPCFIDGVSMVAQKVKESACNAGDSGLIPGLGRSLGGGHGSLLQYFFFFLSLSLFFSFCKWDFSLKPCAWKCDTWYQNRRQIRPLGFFSVSSPLSHQDYSTPSASAV